MDLSVFSGITLPAIRQEGKKFRQYASALSGEYTIHTHININISDLKLINKILQTYYFHC